MLLKHAVKTTNLGRLATVTIVPLLRCLLARVTTTALSFPANPTSCPRLNLNIIKIQQWLACCGMFRRASYKSSSGWHAGACSDELSTNPAEAGMLRHVHTNPAEAGMLRHVPTISFARCCIFYLHVGKVFHLHIFR